MEMLRSLQTTYFKVHVTTNAKSTAYKGWDGSRLAHKISLQSSPHNGKANKELIKFFTKELKRKVKIISGASSREKLLKILH